MSFIAPKKIIINQIDNIGDLVLSLPMIGVLKEKYPKCKVTLLSRSYTQPIINSCDLIDHFIDWESIQTLPDSEIIDLLKKEQATALLHISKNRRVAKLAKEAGIPYRVGSIQRINHWWTCNRFVNIGRRHSKLHEAQLNLLLLHPFGIKQKLDFEALAPYMHFANPVPLPERFSQLIDNDKFTLVIHPGSHGHGREWPPLHYVHLINALDPQHYQVFLTGSPKEEETFSRSIIQKCPQAISLMGRMSLTELVSFIASADGLIASGTGPLHLSAALGIKTLGLFPPRKGISPRRWAPLGKQGEALMFERQFGKMCLGCRDSVGCLCMHRISVPEVNSVVTRWRKNWSEEHCQTKNIPMSLDGIHKPRVTETTDSHQ